MHNKTIIISQMFLYLFINSFLHSFRLFIAISNPQCCHDVVWAYLISAKDHREVIWKKIIYTLKLTENTSRKKIIFTKIWGSKWSFGDSASLCVLPGRVRYLSPMAHSTAWNQVPTEGLHWWRYNLFLWIWPLKPAEWAITINRSNMRNVRCGVSLDRKYFIRLSLEQSLTGSGRPFCWHPSPLLSVIRMTGRFF